MPSPIEIDVYVSPYCNRCKTFFRHLVAIRELTDQAFAIRERSVIDHLESAVAAGVRATPAMVVNGRLLLSGGTTQAGLHRFLKSALETENVNGLNDR